MPTDDWSIKNTFLIKQECNISKTQCRFNHHVFAFIYSLKAKQQISFNGLKCYKTPIGLACFSRIQRDCCVSGTNPCLHSNKQVLVLMSAELFRVLWIFTIYVSKVITCDRPRYRTSGDSVINQKYHSTISMSTKTRFVPISFFFLAIRNVGSWVRAQYH